MARILIVDDSQFLRKTLATIFENENHEIVGEAINGEQAVNLYKQLKPDLVTMDITMPVKDGISAIKEIIMDDEDAVIVVCSAMGQQKVVVQAIESGAKDFILKPFDPSVVVETINKVLSISK